MQKRSPSFFALDVELASKMFRANQELIILTLQAFKPTESAAVPAEPTTPS